MSAMRIRKKAATNLVFADGQHDAIEDGKAVINEGAVLRVRGDLATVVGCDASANRCGHGGRHFGTLHGAALARDIE